MIDRLAELRQEARLDGREGDNEAEDMNDIPQISIGELSMSSDPLATMPSFYLIVENMERRFAELDGVVTQIKRHKDQYNLAIQSDVEHTQGEEINQLISRARGIFNKQVHHPLSLPLTFNPPPPPPPPAAPVRLCLTPVECLFLCLTPHMSETGGVYCYADAHAAPNEALTQQECEVQAPEYYCEGASPVAIPPYGVLVQEPPGEAMLLDGTTLDLDGTLEVEVFDRKCMELYDRFSYETEPVVCIGGRVVAYHTSGISSVCVYDPVSTLVDKREDKNPTWTTKYIGTDGVTYPLLGGQTLDTPDMDKPGVRSLDGMLMLFGGYRFRDTDTPHGNLTPNHDVYLYEVDTDEWTKDIRPSPLLHREDHREPYPLRHSVVHETLHVFRPFTRQHWTYSIRHGWATQDMIPEIGEIFSVQTFDRILCLMCLGGTHLYDTVSGDWARVREAPEVFLEPGVHEGNMAGQNAPVVDYAPVGHNMLLEVPMILEDARVRGEDSESGYSMESGGGYVLSYYTVHESLLYPNEQMGWGRLIEWDLHRERKLGRADDAPLERTERVEVGRRERQGVERRDRVDMG
ncbi:hypothetical protein KIPB_005038 [Kipferlia bialata]|uniref:Uncharacterized protein n=1 Tax=Kipferlia bialata TaxID=797122 RepID=A0A9K3GI83_9EUKA|nr:hypothetical protein KIPB_005038 [Kipferlia bialata]|eukprot:g5038.t1